jgi:hypothetical protein
MIVCFTVTPSASKWYTLIHKVHCLCRDNRCELHCKSIITFVLCISFFGVQKPMESTTTEPSVFNKTDWKHIVTPDDYVENSSLPFKVFTRTEC